MVAGWKEKRMQFDLNPIYEALCFTICLTNNKSSILIKTKQGSEYRIKIGGHCVKHVVNEIQLNAPLPQIIIMHRLLGSKTLKFRVLYTLPKNKPHPSSTVHK